ncbi:MAG: FprA family A-type flavoprotein [Sphingobacteriia bacterium]|nr:FprA family A-type flavoprotein [Sphingobacteriia bacterium]
MYNPYQIVNNIYYVGVNDRHKMFFENMIPLPNGVSYNSYLIVDEKVVLIDTVDTAFCEQFLRQIKEILGNRVVDYVVVDHMEPDHSASLLALIREYPEIQIVGNSKTISMITGFYDICKGFYEVGDGDTLSIGQHQLQFYLTPMVHWPEVMMTYDVTDKILFSADAFGCFGTLDGAVVDAKLQSLDKYWHEMYRYYANIVGKYGSAVQQAFKKLTTLSIETIASTHGPVWTGKRLPQVMSVYDKLSRYEGEKGAVVVYGSMYGHTEEMAETVARGIVENGIPVVLHDVSKSHSADILADIFKYKGLIIGSPTYCNGLYPEIASLINKLEVRGVKNRIFGAFGSFTWAGTSVKNLNLFAEKMGWELIGTVEQKQSLSIENSKSLFELCNNMSLSIK